MQDSGLSSDSCVSIPHGPAPNWWLSPAVVVRSFDGVPVPAGSRTVDVTVNYASSPACQPMAGQDVKVELFVCIPSLVIPPNDGVTSVRIGQQFPVYGAAPPVSFPWAVPSSGTGPNSPGGHRCLIARAYPDSLTADATNLTYGDDDPHYAQKNLCIVTCSSPCGLDAQTFNANLEKPETVTILALADPRPSRAVLKAVMPALQRFKPFKRFSRKLPPPFKIELEGFPNAKVRDHCVRKPGGKLFGRRPVPNYEVQIEMQPKQLARFRFGSDLEEVPVGDAFMIHLTHIVRRRVLGGLTVVFVKVRRKR